MAKNDRQLALAFFDSEPAAREAVEALKQWDKATKEIKLGEIRILAQDAVLSGSIGWGALVLSGMAGGLIGPFGPADRAGKTTTGKEGIAQLIKMLDEGLVAVAVLVSPDEAIALTKRLMDLRDGRSFPFGTEMLR